MKKLFSYLVGGLSLIGLTSCASSDPSKSLNTQTVSKLDVKRYMGQWYEIARFDHTFERGLEGNTALYELNDDGTIKVTNSGYKGDLEGKLKQSVGKARCPNPDIPGALEVAFFMNFYAPYYIMELSEDYSYALVGSKTDKYLWILSRTPEMNPSDLDFVLSRAKERGYNTDDLIWVKHK